MTINIRLLAICATLAMPAAAETVEVNLTYYGTTSSYFEPLSGDLQVYRSQSNSTRFEGVEGSRFDVRNNDCFGSFIIVRGVPSGSGNCVLTDVNGDKVLQAWRIDTVELGRGYGTWHFIGGTGAHEGITGRGTFADETNAVSGTSKNTIKGTVTWPD